MSAPDPHTDETLAALDRAVAHARDFLEGVADRRVPPDAGYAEVRSRFADALPDDGLAAPAVVDELAGKVGDAVMATVGGRFFGLVTGAVLPAALGADVLVGAWDQNPVLSSVAPGVSAVEDVAARWLVDVLGLPRHCSVGFVTGAHMANFTGLATARHHLLTAAGWNLEVDGLFGAPRIRVLAGGERHVSLDLALRYLGLGRAELVDADDQGRMRPDALAAALDGHRGPLIVCTQAGNVNTGGFDPIGEIADLTHAAGGWVHVDGAFGLWAAASPRRRHLVAGHERADSWATDGHKWLNTPYDCGIAVTAHPGAHRAAMSATATYLLAEQGRDGWDWVPESSRRARAVPAWAALRSLGRRGVADLVDRCCDHAARLAAALGAMGDVEVLNDVNLNQVLVRFPCRNGSDADGDARTRAVLDAVQRDGTCYPTGSTWHGLGCVRISVSSWRTTSDDVERSVAAIRRAADAVPG